MLPVPTYAGEVKDGASLYYREFILGFIKEKKFTVRSVIENLTDAGVSDGSPEESEFTVTGFIRQTDEGYTLTYQEQTEGGKVVCDVETGDGEVTVCRRGAICCVMKFGKEPTSTVYEIPPYKFDMTLRTKKIRNTLSLDGGMLDLFYSMNVGGAEKNVRLRITVN
ncbi:MAG: DUF1934 domain-containing protein [Clostridia bacterium]|nr:DUF1934 domain-containing protein [Clostridia bacterium]